MSKKLFFLSLFLAVCLIGCTSTGSRNFKGYEAIGVGLSIEQCKMYCPECKFTQKFTSARSAIGDSFQLWKVETGEKSAYLHVSRGKVEKIKQQPTKGQSMKKKGGKEEKNRFWWDK